ncbi:malto-oligosyltrehalose trehalohydrolase [Uliginosibacterium sp. H1]|uniref:malto-oligosyltrehalose trehalohydrolase n=1 Tax=Uliginosibacterium sp. H1 TaxID=3114757 RepID=UPI002E19F036|nr:malto-oligosyltrehalose trehalohydrolase [Uliginosibacterium sp. H1]
MRFRHDGPFGVQLLPQGAGADFRLWAPAAARVELLRWRGDAVEPTARELVPQHVGWHMLHDEHARAGDRYAYRITGQDGEQVQVPDPASRYSPQGVHEPSVILDPEAFRWSNEELEWKGRPWYEAAIYELHVGCFTPEGTFAALEKRLPWLAELGITAIELMPLADCPGQFGWGYDGVQHYAPKAAYGTPDELKQLVQSAHRLGLMVFLDVVYNHFGPEGNYLHTHAPQFFTTRHQTPWGVGLAFDGEYGRMVRDYFLHNALYWLKEYRFDGLRFDAVDQIHDHSQRHFLHELAATLRSSVGREREIHLVLENGGNEAGRLGPPRAPERFDAQWNDDFHNAMHVLLTGETHHYYMNFAQRPIEHLARCLTEGFAFQGESYETWGRPRGSRSTDLPPSAFINFIQNHDQIGNRAFGDRLTSMCPPQAIRAATALLLLSPMPPMLFMGEEIGSRAPFQYFCDFKEELCQAIRGGRQREFGIGLRGEKLPDPCDPATVQASKVDWALEGPEASVEQREWLSFYRNLLHLRQREIVPLLPRMKTGSHLRRVVGDCALEVVWSMEDGGSLVMQANLCDAGLSIPLPAVGRELFRTGGMQDEHLEAWSVRCFVADPKGDGQ